MRWFFYFLLAALGGGQPRSIFRWVSAAPGPAERFGCFGLSVGLDSFYTNPYDYTEVALRCVFTSPRGRVDTVDGFYMTDCRIDTVTGRVSGGGAGHFAVRYSPAVTGRWTYRIFCEVKGVRQWGPSGHFTCVAGGDPGVLRVGGSPYLSFGGDSAFIPIGENMGWAHANAYLDYSRWITRLVAHKGNFIRVWMPAWGLGLEWRAGPMGYEGLGRYRQSNAALLDWLLDYCRQKHVYVMLSLDHHGQVSSKVDPNWSENPYNAANGGPCAHTWDFFTDARARALIRNRFRDIVARYGYSSHILAWELFNEVDWTDDFRFHRAEVAAWHAEMAAWLRRLDVNRHLITTSFGDARWDSLTWLLPGIDFTQTHYYTNKPIDSVLSSGVARYRAAYGKPTMNGEFGLAGGGRGLAAADPGGVYVHNALWATLLSGAMGPGLSWWWDNYIDPQHLYSCFDGVAAFAGRIDFIRGRYAPVGAAVEGPAGFAARPGAVVATAEAVRGSEAGVGAAVAVRAYALKAADSSRVAGWILNAGGGRAASRVTALRGAVLEVRGRRNGKYAVGWWDCREGVVDGTDTVWVRDGVLRVACPVIDWDKAVIAERVSGMNAGKVSGRPSGTLKGSGHGGE